MDEREDDWNMEDPNDPPFSHVGGKRKYTAKKMEFVGWGSRQLIEFLTSLGKDTSKQISQHAMTSIITEYVNSNGLYHPQKKKKIVCDEKLYSLFGKKLVARIKVYDLLDPHYAENEVDWDDFFSSSDENGEGSSVRYKSSHQLNMRSLETPKSCFASIVPSNIKLVYLKKGLIEELLMNPKTFEGKVVGSFVRIKMNPKDKYANYSYQLQQVIGVKMGSGLGDAVAETLLEVPTDMKEVRLSMLSGDNFSEEECKDLQERVKNGSIKKPTVVELQEKVQQLHEDITKHWIKRELSTLENLIDRANEKGWRKELYEHLERRDLLMNESEQTRLLTEIPVVIAEELEVVVAPQVERSPSSMKESEPTILLTEIPAVIVEELEVIVASQVERSPSSMKESEKTRLLTEIPAVIAENLEVVVAPQVERSPSSMKESEHTRLLIEIPVVIADQLEVLVAPQVERSLNPRLLESDKIDFNMEVNEAASNLEDAAEQNTKEQHANTESCQRQGNHVHPADTPEAACSNEEMDDIQYSAEPQHNFDYEMAAHSIDSAEPQHNNAVEILPDNQTISISRNGENEVVTVKMEHENSGNATNVGIALHGPERELIELSSDDDDAVVENGTVQTKVDLVVVNGTVETEVDLSESPDFELWHYTDPQGVAQGPFSLQWLRHWSDKNFFPSDFMVWKTGQSRGEAVLLVHVLHRVFAP